MNLAGNQAKQLFKSLRTGRTPPTVAMWAAATVVGQLRKRGRPERELLVSKKLKPGESYVIRLPGKDEAPLAESIPAGTSVSTTEAGNAGSLPSQLLDVATDLIAAAAEPAPAPAEEPSRSRRQRRKAARRAKRSADGSRNGSVASPVADAPAGSIEADDARPDGDAARLSRRKRRRADRIASLDEADFDRDGLPRRRLRKLKRAERRARKRPTRRRTRRARRRQRKAATVAAKIERTSGLSRRKRRKLRAAEREVEYRRAKVDGRSTRRRRRKLKKAEKQLGRVAR